MSQVTIKVVVAVDAFRVADLIGSPALQLRVLAGEGGLDRTVTWAHVSELEDPTPWLLGSEVIMTTGMAIPRPATRQRAYLERLDDAGVAALALSAELYVPPLRPAFFTAAEERRLPVLEVPLQVPFIAVAQEVAAALQSDLRRRLGRQLHVFGALRWLAAEDLSVAELFHRLEQLSGYTLYCGTSAGRPLLPGVPSPPPEHRALLPSSPDAPPTVPGGFVCPVAAPGGPAGYLLALERDGARPAGLAVVQHIATVAALHVTMLRHERETTRREGAETLAELLRDILDPTAAHRRLARAGFAAQAPVMLVMIRAADDALDDATVTRALDEAAGAYLLLRQQADLYALVPDSAEIRAALAALPGTRAGASSPFTPGAPLGIPRKEATWALARATDSRQALVVYGDDAAGRWLPDDPALLRSLVDAVLGPAMEYDRKHNSALTTSIRTWLARDRRIDQAAEALHVHPNTLAYRLRRFATITGRNLSSTADLAEIWLALSAARQLGDLP